MDKVYLITKADDIGSNNSANRAFYDAYSRDILKKGMGQADLNRSQDTRILQKQ